MKTEDMTTHLFKPSSKESVLAVEALGLLPPFECPLVGLSVGLRALLVSLQ